MATTSSPYKFYRAERPQKTREEQVRDVDRLMGGRLTEASLSAEQRVAFDHITHWYEKDTATQQVLTLGGFAGTGKSTLVSVLAARYSEEAVVFCAYTGKATSVLRNKLLQLGNLGRCEVKTLHSLMYRPISDASGRVTDWRLRDVIDYDLVVLDEASMVDGEMFEHLKSFGVPILAVGDHGQLPPIFGSFNLMEAPQLRLETIHRQAAHSPILAMADAVRRFGQVPRIANSQELQVVPRRFREEVLCSIFQTAGLNHGDVGVLCYSNAERIDLNALARRARWGDTYREYPLVGDQVICLRNTENRVFNGMRGEVTACADNTVAHYDARVLFADDEFELEGPLCKTQFNRPRTIQDFDEFRRLTGMSVRSWDAVGLLFDYGYALTGHKAQGSQLEHAVVSLDLPNRLSLDEKKRWLYTTFTRASKYLCILQ